MYATLLLLVFLPIQQADPEEAYRRDYSEYNEISAMTDPAAQAERFFAFIDKGYDARLEGSILAGLRGDMEALTQARNYDAVFDVADKWAARNGGLDPIALAWNAGAVAGNNQATVKYGEQLYAAQAIPQVAMSLANAYMALGNAAKLREFGEIVIDSQPITETWSIAYELVGQHESAGRFNQASEMARKIQSGLTSAPEGISGTEWTQIRTYLQETVGRASYEAGRYGAAIQQFNAVLRFNRRNDKAYYYIGESLLKTNEIAPAMNSFAKSYLLNGGYSARSRGMLETIYKANHGGNLVGLEDIINTARRELN
jgi:tetratricopeptide (TPR) repeat protein